MISWMTLIIYINPTIIKKTSLYYSSLEIKVDHSITSLYYGSFDMWFSNCSKSLLPHETKTKSNKTFTKIISFRKYLQFVGLKGRFLGQWEQLSLNNKVFLKLLTVSMKPERHVERKFSSPLYGSFDLNSFFKTFDSFNETSTVFLTLC